MLKQIAFTTGVILLATNLAAGEMYMWQDSEGVRHFSDRPPQRDEKTQVRGEVTTDALKVDRRSRKQPLTANNSSSNTGSELSAPTKPKNEVEAEGSQIAKQNKPASTEENQ